jgi:hypothetical protein
MKDFAKEFPKFMEKTIQEQKTITAKAIVDYFPKLVKSSPVDTGLYAQSWDLIEEEKAIILGNYAPHAPIIEFGARPFTPPLGPLLIWAKRVLKDPSLPPNYSAQVWQLAIGTQRKIEAVGMEPKHIMENGINAILENIRLELSKL